MTECIFCRIALKKAKASIVYDDREIIAFLDVHPIATGHSMVVPKRHDEDLTDIDSRTMGKITDVAQELSRKMKAELGAEWVNWFAMSREPDRQRRSHFHLHVIPRRSDDALKFGEWWKSKTVKTERKELDILAARLRPSRWSAE